MNIFDFIPSFGQFLIDCYESNIDKETALALMFDLLESDVTSEQIVKDILLEHLNIDSYISLMNKLSL